MKEQRYEKIVELVRECGQLVKNADRQHLHVDSKAGHANFVTEYDKKVQERLRAGLCAIMPDAHRKDDRRRAEVLIDLLSVRIDGRVVERRRRQQKRWQEPKQAESFSLISSR